MIQLDKALWRAMGTGKKALLARRCSNNLCLEALKPAFFGNLGGFFRSLTLMSAITNRSTKLAIAL